MGGDGTMIGIGRKLARFGVPVVGINQAGSASSPTSRCRISETHLRPILHGEYEEDHRSRSMPASGATATACSMRSRSTTWWSTEAASPSMIEFGAGRGRRPLRRQPACRRPDHRLAHRLDHATLSVGGSLLHPAIDGWIMAPIAPHTLSNQPDRAAGQRRDHAYRTGQRPRRQRPLRHGDLHKPAAWRQNQGAACAPTSFACILHPVGWSYFDTLRKKLHWNEGMNIRACAACRCAIS